jgi:succinyl-diaminopimelate desuccinylase
LTDFIGAIELTRRLVAFNTVNPPGNERDCAGYLADILSALGFDVRRFEFAPGRTSLVAEISLLAKGTYKPLCFTGHLDTVPLGRAPWSVDPFGGAIVNDRLFGRGASDMKAGIAAFIAAAARHRDALRGSAGLCLILTAGEETGCEGASHLVSQRALGEAAVFIVGEPTSNAPMAGHKGALWLKATARGVTAHGSTPERGVNAVKGAARMVLKLEDFDFNCKRHEILGGPTLNVGTIAGGQNINSVPDHADFGLDIRTVPSMAFDDVKRQIQSYLSPELDELIELKRLAPVWTEPGETWVKEIASIAAEVLGGAHEMRAASYFSDASVLQPAFAEAPTVILGPGAPEMAHQTDEYCRVEKIEEAVEIYSRIIERFLAGKIA